MSLHDSFHVSGPAVFTSNEDARRFIESLTDDDLFNLVTKNFLDLLAEGFKGSLLFFEGFLFIFGLFKVKTFLGAVSELLSVVFL